MLDQFFKSVEKHLLNRWNKRLPYIHTTAQRWLAGKPNSTELAAEAFAAGYRQAYWDGVEDVLQANLDRQVKNVVIAEHALVQ